MPKLSQELPRDKRTPRGAFREQIRFVNARPLISYGLYGVGIQPLRTQTLKNGAWPIELVPTMVCDLWKRP
jgi:hypothetical protein